MHIEVRDYVSQFATGEKIMVLDIGGRDVNGTLRDLFPNADYTVLDLRPGPNVDIIADATEWDPDGRKWDLVLCTEVFEHVKGWQHICWNARKACWPGGKFVATCAGLGRPAHSGFEAVGPQPGEWYSNLSAQQLHSALVATGWDDVHVEQVGLDLHAVATCPKPSP